MDEDERSALREQSPKIVVHSVIEFLAAAAGADGDARETEIVEAAASLVGCFREAQWNRPEAVQPAGTVGDIPGEFVVAPRDGRRDEPAVLGVGAVEERRHGHRVRPHSDVVHLGKPGARVVLRAGEGEGRVLADSAHRRIEQDDAVGGPRQVRQAGVLEPLEQRQWHRMVVHVDRVIASSPMAVRTRVHIQSSALVRCPWWTREYAGATGFLLDGTSSLGSIGASRWECQTPLAGSDGSRSP